MCAASSWASTSLGVESSCAPRAAEMITAPVYPFALVGHSETFLAFALMCVAPRWMFSPLAYFYGVLCIISGVTRVASAIGHLRARAKP